VTHDKAIDLIDDDINRSASAVGRGYSRCSSFPN